MTMSTEIGTDDLLRPMRRTSKEYYYVLAAAAVGIGVFAVAWSIQLRHGLIVTGLADWGSAGGATWGLYIGAFIWWVGIAHGGIILSAAVRLIGMDRYKPVARLAELLTIGALTVAGLYIVVHMGRPDRVVTSIVAAYPWTVHTSPLIWDVTVITLYFVMTATYLGLTIRYDVARLRDELPDRFDPLYRVMLVGYTEREDEIVERMVWWLALAIIVLAPLLLHGGVIPWLFALLPSMPGWFGAIQGPQFLTIALTSAISGVIITAAVFRRVYDWGHIITDDVFKGLTLWLGFFALLFVWLQLQQIVAGVFAPPVDQGAATDAKLSHPVYWIAIGLVLLALGYVFAQGVRPSLFSIERSLAASVAVLAGTLLEKIFFVVEGLLYPSFSLYAATPGAYFPTWVEMASVTGTIGIVVVFFAVVAKVIPVIELHAIEQLQEGER
jgi:molybdopterin-containing oxidoreductase family membrane subunit